MFVLDASVVLKWFIEEEDSERARLLLLAYDRGKITIAIPDLLISEVSNALLYNPNLSYSKILKCIESLYDLNLDIIAPVVDISIATIQFAHKRKITFYDAIYVVLAQELGFQYVTADKKLFTQIKDLPFVNLLKNIKI